MAEGGLPDVTGVKGDILEIVQPELIPVIEAAKAKQEAEKRRENEAKQAEHRAEERADKAEHREKEAESTSSQPAPAQPPQGWGRVAVGAGAVVGGFGAARRLAAKASPGAQTSFFLLGIFIHFTDAFLGFGDKTFRAGAYLVVLTLYGWLFGFKSEGISPVSPDGLRTLLTSFLFGAAAWAWPWGIDKLLGFAQIIPFTAKNIILVFFPLIVVYFLTHEDITKNNKFLRIFRNIYVGVFIAIVLYYFLSSTVVAAEEFGPGAVQVEVKSALIDVWDLVVEVTIGIVKAAAKFIVSTVKVVFGVGSEMMEESKRRALGPYYQGRIDEKAEKKVGVRLDKIKKLGEPYFTNFPVLLQSNFKAETTADVPVNIKFWCKAQKRDEPWIEGTTQPEEIRKVIGRRTDVVNCKFDEGVLPEGSLDVEMAAQFNFRTDTDFTTFFISLEEQNALAIQDVDFFKVYDLKPIPIRSSPGPVNVKISFGEPPRVIDPDLPRSYPMGIRVERMPVWPGKVVQINRLILITPKGVGMEEAYAFRKVTGAAITEFSFENGFEGGFKQVSCVDAGEDEFGCDDSLLNLFEIALGPPEEITTSKDFSITLTIDEPRLVLGDGPYAIQSFGVIADYLSDLAGHTAIFLLR